MKKIKSEHSKKTIWNDSEQMEATSVLQSILDLTQNGKNFNGFIQVYNVSPFIISFYCEDQVELGKFVSLFNKHCFFHLDSTGSVVA